MPNWNMLYSMQSNITEYVGIKLTLLEIVVAGSKENKRDGCAGQIRLCRRSGFGRASMQRVPGDITAQIVQCTFPLVKGF